jgi:hypothetical protein
MALTLDQVGRRLEHAENALSTALGIIDDMLRVGSTALFKMQKEESRASGIKELDHAINNAQQSLQTLKQAKPW